RAYRTRSLNSSVPARHFIAITCGPHDAGIGRIRHSKAGFAASHRVIPSSFLRIDGHTGATHVPVILHVAIEVVRNLIVDVHMVHLPDRQSDPVKTAPV